MATRRSTLASPVTSVQLDGVVVLKIIKHCQEGGSSGSELVQGVLLGLLVDSRLEITNCIPFPRHTEEDDFDEVHYQVEMLRYLRHINVDYLQVGFYVSTYLGSFINRVTVESQFNYQQVIEESVFLIYDPLITSKGHLSIKAFRLTPTMKEFYKEGNFTPESIKQANLSFENILEEIPVVIKNSHLVNALLCEIEESMGTSQKNQLLDVATSSMLQTNLHQLMECVDEVAMDTNKYISYQRQYMKQQQAKQQYQQKRQLENSQRQSKGEQPLPDEDINKLFKPLQPPPRLDSLLNGGQINSYCEQITQFAAQSFGKLFMTEDLQLESKQT